MNTPDDDNNAKLEQALHAAGEAWTQESAPHAHEDKFLQGFQAKLRASQQAPRKTAAVVDVAPLPRRGRSTLYAMVAAAAIIAIVAVSFFYRPADIGTLFYRDQSLIDPVALRAGQSAETEPGDFRLYTLDDTRIQLCLAEDSRITFSSKEVVRLQRGAVWVRVTPNSGRFVVETPHGLVRVHGTEFGVRIDGERTYVRVNSGKVGITAAKEGLTALGNQTERLLDPGMEGTLHVNMLKGPIVEPVTDPDIIPPWASSAFADATAQGASRYYPSAAPKQPKETRSTP